MSSSEHALTDQEAGRRAAIWEKKDPLRHVPRSLLASAEIDDYIRITGMVWPYDATQLKSASYQVHIGGQAILWDEKNKKITRTISRGDRLTLPANSIVFVEAATNFRLPYYIAIRFNLRITHVHRGLLLGTGPLVDPGFQGKLLIPLHNLTSEPYEIDTDKALIWIEFTKTTFGNESKDELASPDRLDVPFPEDKRWKGPDYYLSKANNGNSIRSSIGTAISDSAASAKIAQREVRHIKRLIATFGVIGFLGVAFALYQIMQSNLSIISSVQQTILPVSGDLKAATEKMAITQAATTKLTDRVDELTKLTERVDGLAKQVNEMKNPVVQPVKAPPVRRAKRQKRARAR